MKCAPEVEEPTEEEQTQSWANEISAQMDEAIEQLEHTIEKLDNLGT